MYQVSNFIFSIVVVEQITCLMVSLWKGQSTLSRVYLQFGSSNICGDLNIFLLSLVPNIN